MNIIPDINKGNSVSNTETEQVQQEQKEYILLGTFLRTKGLNLFYYNPANDELKEAVIKYSDTIHLYLVNGKFVLIDWESQRTTVDSKVIYFESLNLRSAQKRITKWKLKQVKELANLRKPSKEGIKFY
jgi:hypothetical protein